MDRVDKTCGNCGNWGAPVEFLASGDFWADCEAVGKYVPGVLAWITGDTGEKLRTKADCPACGFWKPKVIEVEITCQGRYKRTEEGNRCRYDLLSLGEIPEGRYKITLEAIGEADDG